MDFQSQHKDLENISQLNYKKIISFLDFTFWDSFEPFRKQLWISEWKLEHFAISREIPAVI